MAEPLAVQVEPEVAPRMDANGPWLDTSGTPIQAHGGSMLFHDGTYYWYGEDRSGPTLANPVCEFRTDVIGITCYSSTDLRAWRFEGHVLTANPNDDRHDLRPSGVLERPRVVFNDVSQEFVMWLHVDSEDYSYAKAGIAVGDRPTGPFRYLGSIWPNGADSRDLTIFRDEDGTAYLVHATDWNQSLHVARLTPDYRDVSGEYTKALVDQSREAPIIVRAAAGYHMITSGCTGWRPNTALVATAPVMLGRWQIRDHLTDGPVSFRTFGSQGSYAFTRASDGQSIFMADLWVPEDLGRSSYLWLPLTVAEGRLRVSSPSELGRWDGRKS